jgi:Protein of unknown function (DUF3182)
LKSKTDRSRVVVRYSEPDSRPPDFHENISRNQTASKLAQLHGWEFAGRYDPGKHYSGPLYYVPDDTLVGVEAARQLGIHDERDLFGGIVPYPFVATKTITHPLVDRSAQAPDGWRHDLGERLQDAVLPGFTAFSRDDARRAGMLILQRGAARLKPACAIGGRGQVVVSALAELDSVIEGFNEWELSRYGVVVEQNFEKIVTYSVGQVRVGELLASYYGTQNLTKDNNAAAVYGGSALIVSRGDYDALFELDMAPNMRCVIDKARFYEAAVVEAFPEWIAPRRNYDVAEVIDSDCQRNCGVLEQSWRIGGASPAEIAALQAFQADPGLRVVRAISAEIYGTAEMPPQAAVHFQGVDERLGPITKYAVVKDYDGSR